MHPTPGNQGWSIHNMARTHSKNNFKISPRIRDHGQRAPWSAEAMTSGSSIYKYDTFIYQGSREHKLSTTLAVWTNWKIYSDLTGKFTVKSERGNNYILVAYHYYEHKILTTPIKNRTGPWILNGIKKIHDKLRNRGLTTKLHIMDNEVPEDSNKYFEDSDI